MAQLKMTNQFGSSVFQLFYIVACEREQLQSSNSRPDLQGGAK